MSKGFDMNVSRAQFEKPIGEDNMPKYTVQELIAVIVAAVVGIAFLLVVAMPLFGVNADPQVQTAIMSAFFGLVGLGGGIAYKQQEVKVMQAQMSALSERGVL